MRLWVRVAVVMAVVSLVPLVLMGTRAISIATGEAAHSSEAILLRDADAMSTFVDTWMNDQVQAAAGWMQLFPLENQSVDEQESFQKSVFLAVPSIVTVVLVDADGVPLVRPLYITAPGARGTTLEGRIPGDAVRASDLIERIPLTEALAGRFTLATGVVGDPYVPPGAREASVPIGVTGPFDEGIVLGAEVSLDVLAREVAQRSTPDHQVALLTASGKDIAGGAQPLVDTSRLKPVLTTRSTVAYARPDGREVRGAIAPIASTGWSVVVAEPASVAERAAHLIRRRTTWVLLVAVALALVFGLVLARNVSEPVGRLRDTVLAVAEGDVGATAGIDRRDEIGDLARAFDTMSLRLRDNEESLRAQQAEIEAFNEELQERVEERTRELREAQEQLVRSGQLAAVAEVGAGLAHELNNPLSAILGLTQVLALKRQGTDDETTLRRIEEQAQRCRTVVGAMLRLASGEVDPVDAGVVDLREILSDVLELVTGPFRQRGVSVEWSEPDEPLRVRIHPIYGTRILAQILNAFRAGLEEGATLRVTTTQVGDEVAIDLDPDRTIAMGNARDDWMASGMGLWVARHLLDQIGGRLEEPLPPMTRWRILLPGAP